MLIQLTIVEYAERADIDLMLARVLDLAPSYEPITSNYKALCARPSWDWVT